MNGSDKKGREIGFFSTILGSQPINKIENKTEIPNKIKRLVISNAPLNCFYYIKITPIKSITQGDKQLTSQSLYHSFVRHLAVDLLLKKCH
jgi:hypothetical protein